MNLVRLYRKRNWCTGRHSMAAFASKLALVLFPGVTASYGQLPNGSRAEQDLLRHQIVDLGAGLDSGDGAIHQFETNNSSYGAGPVWHVNIPARDGTSHYYTLECRWVATRHDYNGNQNDPAHGLKSSVTVSGRDRSFTLTNVTVPMRDICVNVPNYGVTATLVVPGCKFDFSTAETCFPSSVIATTSANPPLNLTLTQPGRTALNVAPGAFLRFDRSLGDATITMASIEGNTFTPLVVSLRVNDGPEISLSPDLSHAARFATYEKLAELRTAIGLKEQATADPYQVLDLKTLHAQVRMISAYAIHARYPDVVRALLVSRAKDIASADAQVLALRKLVIAGAALSSNEVDLTISRVGDLLADPHVANRDTLNTIRQELIRARDSVGAAGGAVNLIKDNLISAVDLQIADYQTLVLEYAQFVDDATLASAVPEDNKAAIVGGLSPADIRISDDALGGRGKAIRLAFGLPSP